VRRAEVYWIRLDPIEGSEQTGTRPGVIVSRNAINRHSPVVVICPLTNARHVSRLYPSDVVVRAPEAGLQVDSVALTLQVRAVAKSRLHQRLGELASDTMAQIDHALKITLDLP
jgi:mRNA interferase MazF